MPQLKVWRDVSGRELRKYATVHGVDEINLVHDSDRGVMRFLFPCGGIGSMFFLDFEEMVKYLKRWKLLSGTIIKIDGKEEEHFWEAKK